MLHKGPSTVSGQLDLGDSRIKFKSEKQTQTHSRSPETALGGFCFKW